MIDCAWSKWIYSEESGDHCSKRCGGGERHRKRRLESTDGSKGNCHEKLPNKEGYEYEVETCNTFECISKWIYHIQILECQIKIIYFFLSFRNI